MPKPLPPLDLLHELLSYSPETGALTWKVRNRKHFATNLSCATWNSRFAGKEAFSVSEHGYLSGAIFAQRYYAHRIAYFLHHGVEPMLVDHIDGNRHNNRADNLREVNTASNFKNLGLRSSNSNGVFGVSQHKRNKKWMAKIQNNGVAIYLGQFDTFEEAAAARFGAERALGFHENHGGRMAKNRNPRPVAGSEARP